MKSTESWGLHWFRRDLRIWGNPALRKNWIDNKGRVLGIFCFDPSFLSRADFSPDRFAFFLRTLGQLKKEMKALGGDLLVLDEGPDKSFDKLFNLLKRNSQLPSCVSFNRDYEPFARNRDQRMSKLFESWGIDSHSERDHLLFEPAEIEKNGGGFYSVYTPFFRKWLEHLCSKEGSRRIDEQAQALKQMRSRSEKLFSLKWSALLANIGDQDALDSTLAKTEKLTRVPIPQAGTAQAFAHLKGFSEKLENYGSDRDIPAVSATSGLSIFLKNGSITTAQIIAELQLNKADVRRSPSALQYLKELCWREFYYHILWHRPDVESGPFQKRYSKIRWSENKGHFERWKNGETGFPIVDAGMRQLNQTGWMHNRVRMIVASFLVKDLHLNWQWGEEYFMNRLLDGDLAPNNGGWQWAASTGCDPQPYFRVFNPTLQSEKFDPDGLYIRKYVAELKNWKSADFTDAPNSTQYPKPIVDHATAKVKAIAMFKGL